MRLKTNKLRIAWLMLALGLATGQAQAAEVPVQPTPSVQVPATGEHLDWDRVGSVATMSV